VSEVRQGETSIFAKGIDVGPLTPAPLEVFVKSDGGAVEGVVRTNAASTVALIPDDRQMMRLAQYANTDTDGRFSFKGVRPGAYKVFAVPVISNAPQLIPNKLLKIEEKGSPVTVKASTTTTTPVSIIEDN
jgi:hypothetical protein